MMPRFKFYDEPCTLENIGPDWIRVSEWAGCNMKNNVMPKYIDKNRYSLYDGEDIILDSVDRDIIMEELSILTGLSDPRNIFKFYRGKNSRIIDGRYKIVRITPD